MKKPSRPTRRSPKPKAARRAAHLLGVGLDNEDGHQRITQGEQFTLVGGSEQTHDRMTETIVKTFEALKAGGKRLQNVEPQELAEIIHQSTPR